MGIKAGTGRLLRSRDAVVAAVAGCAATAAMLFIGNVIRFAAGQMPIGVGDFPNAISAITADSAIHRAANQK